MIAPENVKKFEEIKEELHERGIPIPKDESMVFLFGEIFEIQQQIVEIKEYFGMDEK